MPHRIGRHEAIGPALLRLAAEDLAAARLALAGGAPSDQTIHRVRQRLKRTRSVLRVLRPALDGKAERCAEKLRAAARLLSQSRDADVAAESAREFTSTAHGDDAGFGRVVVFLDREARAQQPTSVERVTRLIADSERQLARASKSVAGRALLAKAIDHAYRRGLAARRGAELNLTTHDLHQWRKAVKDLWHLLRLARRRLPRRAAPLMAEFERLGELLGLDHDHAVLAEKLATAPTDDPALMEQLGLIARRRRALEAEAFILGAKLYRQKPKKFSQRLALA